MTDISDQGGSTNGVGLPKMPASWVDKPLELNKKLKRRRRILVDHGISLGGVCWKCSNIPNPKLEKACRCEPVELTDAERRFTRTSATRWTYR